MDELTDGVGTIASPPQFAFCLEMLYPERPFLERIALAKSDGIDAIEIWNWRNKDLAALASELAKHNIRLINMSGNRKFGMLDPEEHDQFLQEVRECAEVAKQLGCPRLMLLAQALQPDDTAKPVTSAISTREKIVQGVRAGRMVGKIADEFGLDIVIEPLNSVLDHPGFFMDTSWLAFQMIREMGHPRVKVLYDVYHMAMMDENIELDLTRNLDAIGYIHLADKPGRHEPGSGKLDFAGILDLLSGLNYRQPVGFEFTPSTEDSSQAIRKALRVTKELAAGAQVQ